jgi:hypothetical protein
VNFSEEEIPRCYQSHLLPHPDRREKEHCQGSEGTSSRARQQKAHSQYSCFLRYIYQGSHLVFNFLSIFPSSLYLSLIHSCGTSRNKLIALIDLAHLRKEMIQNMSWQALTKKLDAFDEVHLTTKRRMPLNLLDLLIY